MRPALLLMALAATAPAQWTLQPSHTTASLRGIHAVTPEIAWASGTSGTVLHTTDGGAHWLPCATPPAAEHLDFRGVQAFDAQTAIVMSSGKGDLSRLYKTTDACQTWTLVFTNPDKEGFWDAIQFRTRSEGVLLGDPVDGIFVVMLTFDGGMKWERQALKATADINGESVFAASNSALLVDKYPGSRQFCTGGRGGPRLITLSAGPDEDSNWYSTVQDGKLHFSRELYAYRFQTKSPRFETSGCFSLAISNDGLRTIVGVGGNFQEPNGRDDTAWTSAVRLNPAEPDVNLLYAARTPPHGYRSSVAYSPTQKSWITVGPNGTDISTDDGRNWHPLRPGPTEPPDADKNWNALSLPFAVGPKGRIGRLR